MVIESLRLLKYFLFRLLRRVPDARLRRELSRAAREESVSAGVHR